MRLWIYTAVVCLFSGNLFAIKPDTNQSQWRGADRTGIYHEENLLKSWPEGGPELLWTAENLGAGYAAVTVSNDAVYVTGITDTMEHITALNLNGQVKWKVNYGRAWYRDFPHARCTPTIDGNCVYVISGGGEISCLRTDSGEKVWSINAYEKFNGRWGIWGTAENPLIVGEKLIYTPCGAKTTMVALDKNTGETIWESNSLNDTSAYVSPIVVDYAGKQLVLQVTANHLIGVDANEGSIQFQHKYTGVNPPDHPMAPMINATSPLYHDGQIYITSGYNHVGVAYKLNDDAAGLSVAWVDTVLDNHHGGVVLVDGVIYGSNWLDNRRGNWCAVDWKTGKKHYEKEWFTKGAIVYADGHLYCYEERRGNVALVKATPEDFEITGSFTLPKGDGPHWAHPVISDGVLYMRHGKALMVYNIK